ncbi:MAG: EAL domain-containing protein [Pseudomonadales bacterium]
MARKSTIKLLLINESDNESERLISLFRNAGRVARAHRAVSAEDLHNMLNTESWDLLIANGKHPEITVEQCLEQLKKSATDLPAIVIRDKDLQSALDAGASDVVSSEDDQRLVFAAFREIQHLEKHRELVWVKEKLANAEERCALLMDQSQDAIAYISDGMLVSANALFCSRFGYSDPDDLDCAPVIDLLAPADHDKFKGLLKSQLASGEGNTDFSFNGCKQDGANFSATMQLSNAVYDDEPCIQLSVKDQSASVNNSAGSATLDLDPATRLYSHDYFLAQLDSHTKQAAAGTSVSTLLFIGIDKFSSFRSRLGITHAHNILLDIAKLIQLQSNDANYLAHFCDDGFTLLLEDTGVDKALTYAKSLCKNLEAHIIEIDNQSIQCTASIGLLVLDTRVQDDPNVLIENAFNTCEQIRDDADNEGIGNAAAVYIPSHDKKSLGDATDDEELDRFLEEALEDGQFSLTFQPVVSLRGTSGDYYEVQTRMINADGQEQHADEFLTTLQFNKANTRLDRWIILEATKQLASQINNNQHLCLLINLTANALQDETLLPWLNVALKAGGIPKGALVFQFVESDITDYLKPAKIFAQAIKEVGCKISISDFGLVDDPFKTLKRIGTDFTKISAKLTKALHSGGDTQMLKAMINSINENESKAIIGGVENAAALALLWQLGVDYIQGAYMAGPSKKMDYEFTDIA